MLKKQRAKDKIVKVWIIEKGVPSEYLGVLITRIDGDVWYIAKKLSTSIVRVVKAELVFKSHTLALASLKKIDVYYISHDRLVRADGQRKSDGSLIAYEKCGTEMRYRSLFSTKGKAARALARNLWREKRRLATRIRQIDRLLKM